MTREDAWRPIDSVGRKMDEGLLSRILDKVYGKEYEFLAQEAIDRVRDAIDFYDYYNLTGQEWTPTTALGYRPTVLTVNLARWFVKKRVAWMFENSPDIECPAEKRDDRKALERQKYLYEVWRDNRFDEKLMAGGTDFFIGGTVGLRLRNTRRGLKLNFSPCQSVFPVPSDEDPDEIKACHFVSYHHNRNQIWHQSWEMVGDRVLLSEGIFGSEKLELIQEIYNGVDTKLDFLPCYVIPHNPLSGELTGTSYLHDLVPLFNQYNRVMSDASDGLRFNLFAVTVLLNAAPDAEKQLKMSPNELWNIGGDGVDAKKLESGFNYSNALSDFLNRLENLMHLIGEVPDVTADRIKGFGLVSGVALKMLYADLISATSSSWRSWKSQLVRMNEDIIHMSNTYKIRRISGTDNRVIPHLPLPENEMEVINMEVTKLSNDLQSVRGAMEEIGERYPLQKIAEIMEERKIGISGPSEGVSGGNEEVPEGT